jgi:hypothetical protein
MEAPNMSVAPLGPGSSQQLADLTLSPTPGELELPLTRGPLADRAPIPGDFRGQSLQLSGRIAQLERATIETHRSSDQLAELDLLITELESIVTRTSSATSESISASQARVDEIVDSITSLAHGHSEPALRGQGLGPGSTVTNIADGVIVHDAQAKLLPGESLDATIEITASAQTAGFYLSFGGSTLNLGGAGASDGLASTFIIDVEGVNGTRQFTYASGTSIKDIASSINALAEQLGVTATLSGTGVVLETSETGSSEFVSVTVRDDASINTSIAHAGIYDLESNELRAATSSSLKLFSNATSPVADYGQDVAALINGIAASGVGRTLTIDTDAFSATFELPTSLAQQGPGNPFNAFTLASRVQPPSESDGAGKHGRDVDRSPSAQPVASQLQPLRSGAEYALINVESIDGAVDTVGLARATLDERQALLDSQRQALAQELELATSQLTGLMTTRTSSPEPLNPQRTAELLRMGLFGQG